MFIGHRDFRPFANFLRVPSRENPSYIQKAMADFGQANFKMKMKMSAIQKDVC